MYEKDKLSDISIEDSLLDIFNRMKSKQGPKNYWDQPTPTTVSGKKAFDEAMEEWIKDWTRKNNPFYYIMNYEYNQKQIT